MKLKIRKQKTEKFTNMCKVNNTLLNNQWVKDEDKEIRKHLEKNKNKQHTTCHGMHEKQFYEGILQ